MTLVIRITLAVVFGVGSVWSTGCNSKNEAQPNPDLTIPDVPPAGHADGKGDLKAGTKKPQR